MCLRIRGGQIVNGIKERGIDLHTGSPEEHESTHPTLSGGHEDSQLLPCLVPGGFPVVTVRHPDPFLHFCTVLGENCKKLTGASGL